MVSITITTEKGKKQTFNTKNNKTNHIFIANKKSILKVYVTDYKGRYIKISKVKKQKGSKVMIQGELI